MGRFGFVVTDLDGDRDTFRSVCRSPVVFCIEGEDLDS